MNTVYAYLDSPVGRLLLTRNESGLTRVYFETDGKPRYPDHTWVLDPDGLSTAIKQLQEYFVGTRYTFDLDLAPEGTAFQQNVWRVLREIPYGETISYGELAKRIGKPSAVRAVGAANGRNPLGIVVPCHRVIGSDGSLTGFGGGLHVKKALLDLERKHNPVPSRQLTLL